MIRHTPLFLRAYGDGVSQLPRPILIIHDVSRERVWKGRAWCRRGNSVAARLACWLFRFPPPLDNAAITLTMTPHRDGEQWDRIFGDDRMRSQLRPGARPDLVAESISLFAGVSRMEPDETGVTQRLIAVYCAGLPLPKIFWPHLAAREGADGSRYLFSVTMDLPWGAPLVHYHGWLETEGENCG